MKTLMPAAMNLVIVLKDSLSTGPSRQVASHDFFGGGEKFWGTGTNLGEAAFYYYAYRKMTAVRNGVC